MEIIEGRLGDFNSHISDARAKLEKSDCAIDTNRRLIEEAEHQIHELEGGATLVIQVPVVEKSKIETKRKGHKKSNLEVVASSVVHEPFQVTHPGVLAAQSSR